MTRIRIVVAPNAFKGCLSAVDVADAMSQAAAAVCPLAEIVSLPMADGGDGTMKTLVSSVPDAKLIKMNVADPLLRPIEVEYGIINGGKTAIIDMASASGLALLKDKERNPLKATSYGTGQLMKDALDRGIEKIVLGIGGSATIDGGIGIAAALGYKLYDKAGEEITNWCGESLANIGRIDGTQIHPGLKTAKITVACDVDNPLCGETGAAFVFGEQKGANKASIRTLDAGLRNLDDVWKKTFNITMLNEKGSGAAGGVGAGLRVFCNAELKPGFDLVAETSGLDKAIRKANLVLTGEGAVDESTKYGKVPYGVGLRAKKYKIPVICLAGHLGANAHTILGAPEAAADGGHPPGLYDLESGITSLFSIAPGPVDEKVSMENAREYIRNTSENVIRLWWSGFHASLGKVTAAGEGEIRPLRQPPPESTHNFVVEFVRSTFHLQTDHQTSIGPRRPFEGRGGPGKKRKCTSCKDWLKKCKCPKTDNGQKKDDNKMTPGVPGTMTHTLAPPQPQQMQMTAMNPKPY
eukprot:GFYU01002883.1.p1 GENE.GFYU01002883.1~~GFYU01002883.1.p1  ORF type:complete len:523 (+),score=141.85 GFYU01002883.1:90-1658(+)